MELEDMILVSVDDHVVEPPDVFENHLPAKYKDIAPRIERQADGTDRWIFLDFQIPNVGLNAVAGRPPEEFLAAITSYYASIYPAVWSFCLAARARGLGTALTTVHLLNEKGAAELLGIPNDVAQMGLIPVAYTIGDDFKPASRPPVETITSFDSWSL